MILKEEPNSYFVVYSDEIFFTTFWKVSKILYESRAGLCLMNP